MITRQHTPGPWHDAVAHAYEKYGEIAPHLGAAKLGLTLIEMKSICRWVKSHKRTDSEAMINPSQQAAE